MTIDPDMVATWRKLFPQDDQPGDMPAGLVSVVVMRSFTNVVAPRPPGNVHGAQSFSLYRIPAPGEWVRTEISCTKKEMKGERRWLSLASTTSDADGNCCFTAEMVIAWAA